MRSEVACVPAARSSGNPADGASSVPFAHLPAPITLTGAVPSRVSVSGYVSVVRPSGLARTRTSPPPWASDLSTAAWIVSHGAAAPSQAPASLAPGVEAPTKMSAADADAGTESPRTTATPTATRTIVYQCGR